MPVTLATDDSVYENNVLLSDAPAVLVTGDRVRFVNHGEVRSTITTRGAIELTGDGTTVINDADARIAAASSTGLAILGSEGNDRIENAGIIFGAVRLGGGDDVFVARRGLDINTPIDFGSGNDSFEFLVTGDSYAPISANGGAGFDQLRVGPAGYVNAPASSISSA